MKILEFLKKPLYSYNNRSNQKKFILECEISNSTDYNNTSIDLPTNNPTANEVTLKKKFYSFTKPSKQFINDLMPKKLRSSDSIKSHHSTTSSNDSKESDESYPSRVCFDNYAYGNFSSTDINLDTDESNVDQLK